jgi:adenylate cyclase class 2
MFEIEKKYRLNSIQFEEVQKSLLELEADYLGEDFEENIVFGNQTLKDQKAILRVRKINEKTILTFKQFVPNQFGVKEHIEFETEVSDSVQMIEIINYMGLEKKLVYEKRRKTWKFKKVEVMLDELPFGLFMEIEGAVTSIAEAELFLEAEEFEVVEESYPFLTYKLGKKLGKTVEARF